MIVTVGFYFLMLIDSPSDETRDYLEIQGSSWQTNPIGDEHRVKVST